jgi:hypothetical protein
MSDIEKSLTKLSIKYEISGLKIISNKKGVSFL